MESVHLANVARWLPPRMMCAAEKSDSRVRHCWLPARVFLETNRGEVSMTSFPIVPFESGHTDAKDSFQ